MTTHALLWTVLLAAAAPAARASDRIVQVDKTYRLEWEELSRVTRGRRVDLTLPSGTQLRGTVVAVEPDDLVLDVRKTSDKRAVPKGHYAIPRADVTRLRVTEKARHTWRAIGLAVGAGIGTLTAIGVGALTGNAAAAALSVVIPTSVGYLIGWGGDYPKGFDVVVEPGSKARVDRGTE